MPTIPESRSQRLTASRRVLRLDCLAILSALALAGCPSKPQTVVVPASDPTAPTALWIQADVPGQPLTNVPLGAPDASVTAGHTDVIHVTAMGTDNDGGLQRVRIWMSVQRTSAGVISGPGLAGAPTAENASTATVGQKAEVTRSVSLDLGVDTLMRNANSLKLELHAEAVNFSGRSVTTALLRIRVNVLNLRLHVVALRNDDGSFGFDATPEDFVRLISRANRPFNTTGLRIVFNPRADFEAFDRTVLNRQQAGWTTIADSIAAAHPGQIVGILRWGGDVDRTGNANAYPPPGASTRHPAINDVDQRYVMLENFLHDTDYSFLNLLGGSHLAHELAHYLGLYHTFVDWTAALGVVYAPLFATGVPAPTEAQVDQRVVDFIASQTPATVDALDGDQIADTPPDPSPVLYTAHGQNSCTDPSIAVTGTSGGSPVSYTFKPDVGNVMSYFSNCGTDGAGVPLPLHFTAGQVARMKAVLASDPRRTQLIAGQP
jgi:hypothetical protein